MKKINVLGVLFALDVQGERAARFIIERINQNAETVADSINCNICSLMKLMFQFCQMG